MPSTSRMTLEAGDLTWTWLSSTFIQSTGSLASLFSAFFVISSSLHFESPANKDGENEEERLESTVRSRWSIRGQASARI